MRRWLMLGLAVITAGTACTEREQPGAPETAATAPPRDIDLSKTEYTGTADGTGLTAAPGTAMPGGRPDATPQPAPAPAAIEPRLVSSQQEGAPPSMIIRTGQASVEVDSLEPAVAQVQALAIQLGGYVASTTMQTGRHQLRSATLELKIPSGRFDQAVSGLRPIGKLEFVNVNAQDVGEEYVDLTARTQNARRLETRLIELLGSRTGRLQDVLMVERELARVREEIERYEGRLRYLRTRSAMSTLAVTVHEPAPLIGAHPSHNPIVEAFREAWRNFVGFVAAIIASLGIVIPVAAIAAALWVATRRLRRRPRPGGESPA